MADLTTATGTREFIAGLDEVDLARFRVVGTYTRYDEAVRNALQDARQQIIAGFEQAIRYASSAVGSQRPDAEGGR